MYGWGGYLEVFNQNSFTSPAITSPFSSQGDIDLALIKYTSAGIAQWTT